MRKLFPCKPSSPLDVLGDAPAMWPTMPAGDPDSDLGPDTAYDTADDAGLVEHTPILDEVVVWWRTVHGDIPAGVIA